MKIAKYQLYLLCLLFLSIATAKPVVANESKQLTIAIGNRPNQMKFNQKISIDSKDLLAQNNLTRITGIEVIQTESGLKLILETVAGSERLVPLIVPEGNSLVIDILDATLAFSIRNGVTELNPAPGISRVTVNRAEENSIRVRITGENQTPSAEVIPGRDDLVLSVTSEGATAETEPDESIDIIATGEGEDDYFVPEASTATRSNTDILDTPQSVQVVPQEVLEDQQILRVDDALRNVSGVEGRLNAFGSSGRLTIRGFTVDNFTAGAILRDGFRVNDNLSSQETANVERIEVIKGPSSVLYGQSDPGGLINLVTKRPLAKPFYEFNFQAGSYSLLRPSIDFSSPLTQDGSLSYRLNAVYQHENSFRDFETDTERFFVAPVLSWDISDRAKFSLVLEYLDESSPQDLGIPAIGDEVVDVPRDRIIGEPDDYIDTQSLTLGYDLEYEFVDDWRLNHGFRYINQDYFVLATLPFFIDETTGDVTRAFADRQYNSDDYTIQTSVIGEFNTGAIEHTLLAGFDLNFNRFDERFTRVDSTPSILNIFDPVYRTLPRPDFDDLPPSPAFDTEYDRIGGFIQDRISFGDSFILVGSLRYDDVEYRNLGDETDQRSASSWSPRFGFIYQPIETVSLYANYSESFTPPFGQTATGETLDPQEAQGYEVGVKTELLDSNIFATLAYFNVTKTNVVTTDPNDPFFVVASGEQNSQGIELDVAGKILPGWNIIANYAYTDAEVTEDNSGNEGNRLFNAPRHSAGLWTTYEFQQGDLEGLGFGFGFDYVGDREGDLANSFEIGDYFLTNAALFYERNNWRLGLNFNNLFDIEYIASTDNSRSFGNTPGQPLTVVGSVSVEF